MALTGGSNCPNCGMAYSPDAKQAAIITDVFKKLDDLIRGLRKQVNALRTSDGETLEEVCPALNDSLDQFIKEVMILKDSNKKLAKVTVAERSLIDAPVAKAGLKPKPGSRDFSFSREFSLPCLFASTTW